jgi:hypothetical protein
MYCRGPTYKKIAGFPCLGNQRQAEKESKRIANPLSGLSSLPGVLWFFILGKQPYKAIPKGTALYETLKK